MAQLTLQIDSPSLMEQLKGVLSHIQGVKIVSANPVAKSMSKEYIPIVR